MKVEDLLKIHQTSCNRLDALYDSTLEFFNNIIKMVESQINNFQEWSEKSFVIRRIFKKNDGETTTAEELSRILEDIK